MESRKIDKYSVYSDGRIHDDYYDADIVPKIDHNGYLKAKLFLNGKYVQVWVHRLIAQLFMSNYNPNNLIIHLDNNKLNNDISNLSQLLPYIKYSKIKADNLPDFKVSSYDPYNMSIIYFDSLDEASLWIKSTGIEDELYRIKLNIFNVVDDNKSAYGYRWNSV